MNDWRPFVYGGLASVTAECGTFPIDTTKTRLQIQGQTIDARHTQLKYRGMLHAAFKIGSEEGICALYSGLAPAVLRQATYGTIKIGVYHTLKRLVNKDAKDEKLIINVGCGVAAGVVSSAIANPTDLLKVRMQAQNESVAKKGMLSSFMDIYSKEGITGLWRGVGPTANRAAIVAGVELPVYDVCKKYILRSGKLDDNVYTHFIASVGAGLACAIACNPVDVINTDGVGPTANRAAIVAGVELPVYDVCKKYILRSGKLDDNVYTHFIASVGAGLACAIACNPVDVINTDGVGPTANRAAIVAGVELPVYDVCKKYILRSGKLDDNVYTHFISSIIAGLAGAIASNPVDVVKTRLMNQRKLKLAAVNGSPAIYSGSLDCFVQTYRTEGFLALYKGFIPNWVRLGPWNVIFFLTFEQLRKLNV